MEKSMFYNTYTLLMVGFWSTVESFFIKVQTVVA